VPDPPPSQAEPAATTRHAAVAQQEMPSSAPVSQGQMEVDLTSILGALEEDADSPSPAALSPSVIANKGKADQSAQHLKLGRTYLEMGMIDEATTALKNAAQAPSVRFEAASMLARLYKEQGDLPSAIEWFVQASEVPAPAEEEGWALLYDLALTLEEAGEIERALMVLVGLQAEAGTYRDVVERIARLQSKQKGG
jgi:tetratricopeptide (TPR) repeat protein